MPEAASGDSQLDLTASLAYDGINVEDGDLPRGERWNYAVPDGPSVMSMTRWGVVRALESKTE